MGTTDDAAPSSLIVRPLWDGKVNVSFGAVTFCEGWTTTGCISIDSSGCDSTEGVSAPPPHKFIKAFLKSSICVLRAWFSYSKMLTFSSVEVLGAIFCYSRIRIPCFTGDWFTFPPFLMGENGTFYGESDWIGSNTDILWLGDCWFVKFAKGEELLIISTAVGCITTFWSIYFWINFLLGDWTASLKGLNFLK